MKTIFWLSIAVIGYTYIGYGILLFAGMVVRRIFSPKNEMQTGAFTPTLTVVVTAYNEISCIEEKIQNTLSLCYPPGLVEVIFITDGSDDGTPEVVARYTAIKAMHTAQRNGKIAAMQRAMQKVASEIVVFTDANTLLNADALLQLAKHYRDKKTGAVSGEKRMAVAAWADATAGEGVYWKYESLLKYWESKLYSVAGAAGELFSIRTRLYEPVPDDTILDDLAISMQIALKGYRIKYEPQAYATEKTSPSIPEESKRKLRIAAGDIQAMLRLPFFSLLFSQPLLWVAYVSHKVLRWVVTPYLLILVFVLNSWIVWKEIAGSLTNALLYAQVFFYLVAFTGWLLRRKKIRSVLFFVPYYFCLMNYSIVAGTLRYLFKGQPVNWEKAARQ